MNETNQLLDKYEQNVEYITSQDDVYSTDADMVKELAPAPTAEGKIVLTELEQPTIEKHEEKLDSGTSQSDTKAVDAGMANGLAKAAIVGAVGIALGTVAAALAGKFKPQINRTVKGVGDAAKNVANGVNHTVKDALDTVKDTVEDAQLSAKGAVDTVKDTVSDNQTFKLYEERLVADKRKVNTAEVSISKHVETQTAHISVSLEKERVVVERIIPVNAGTPVVGEANFSEGEIARIKVYEETPDVQKLAFLREEISVRKQVEQVAVEVEDIIRREELDVDIQDTNAINETKTL